LENRQQGEINALRAENAELKARLTALEERLGSYALTTLNSQI